jgi:hypothetical protein
MNKKLTLTIEEEVIEIAKSYANEKGQSLSELVENYFKLLTHKKIDRNPRQLSPKIQRLRGILKLEDDSDYKNALEEELNKKYGK